MTCCLCVLFFFFCKQKTAYEVRISDWSSDVCSSDLVAAIRDALQATFAPTVLEVRDDSHHHAGHAGARDGRGHFDVRIVSEAFAGMAPLARHRAVYAAMGELMTTDIHALSIRAGTPDESCAVAPGRAGERRVGKEGVSTFRSRGQPIHYKKHSTQNNQNR